MTQQNAKIKKYGIVAIVGAPNAGKSTITNSLATVKLAIVSPKIQTTRTSLKAIINQEENQLIIIDTPGIFIPQDHRILERVIVKTAWQALREANHICFVVDVSCGINEQNKQIISDLKKEELPITVLLNKIDLVKKYKLLNIINDLQNLGLNNIIPISALQNDGIEQLKNFLFTQCQYPGWLYQKNEITNASNRFLASEITREKLFLHLNQEIPYQLNVLTDSYQIFNNKSIKIHQTILVSKNNQKTIILGKNGEMIKKIGMLAKQEISYLVKTKVHLFLFIKVNANWMKNIENFENLKLDKLPL
jgi:GTP-binding protein Era